MVTTMLLRDFSRRTTEVTRLVAEGDVILGRRDPYPSTRERHEREVKGFSHRSGPDRPAQGAS